MAILVEAGRKALFTTLTLAVAAELEKALPKQDKYAVAMAAKKVFDKKVTVVRR